MFKATPNPPQSDDVSPYDPLDPKKLNEAADRALDHYLNPLKSAIPPRKPSTIYLIARISTPKPCWSTLANPWLQPVSWPATSPGFSKARNATRCWPFSKSLCWASWR